MRRWHFKVIRDVDSEHGGLEGVDGGLTLAFDDSDKAGCEGVNGGLALALNVINNSLVVSVGVVDLHKAGTDGRGLKVSV